MSRTPKRALHRTPVFEAVFESVHALAFAFVWGLIGLALAAPAAADGDRDRRQD